MWVDIGDDAAVRHDGVVVTVDTLVEGVHFRSDIDAAHLGEKVLAVSVSDVAAMGATPDHAVLSLSLPPGRADWVARLGDGLARACATYGVDLIGGDTTRSPGPVVVSLTLMGALLGRPWRRDGARPADRLLVTGPLGLAGAGWLDRTPSEAARRALERPSPPHRLPRAFHDHHVRVHAAMDLSDGLATDAPRMARSSGVALHIDPGALPFAEALAGRPDLLRLQTCGGEDYQLLLALPPDEVDRATAAATTVGVHLTEIGVVADGEGAHLTGSAWPTGAFDHFPLEGS